MTGEGTTATEDAPIPRVEFDRALHSPARLKVAMVLAANGVSTFNELTEYAGLTAGNLANHLKTLEREGYVEAARRLVDLKPRMRYRLTPEGRDALRAYCRALEATVQGIRGVVAPGGPDEDA